MKVQVKIGDDIIDMKEDQIVDECEYRYRINKIQRKLKEKEVDKEDE